MALHPPTRIYQNHHLDSTRWQQFTPRPSDIVITTAYKAGTTWMQAIVTQLLFGDAVPAPLATLSPWLDMRFSPLPPMLATLDAQTHRRSLKSHLQLDGVPFYDALKYVYVGRHGPDVFMSLWNHFSGYTPEMRARLADPVGLIGDPQPPCPADVRELWAAWCTRGWFPWERDGYPFWSLLHHVETWWEVRHAPNVLFVHFNDLLADLRGQMQRVADFLELSVPPDAWPARMQAVTFAAMKEQPERYAPGMGQAFEGGAARFLHKGTNGRYRDVLTDADLALYQARVREQLSAPCARWLEHGGAIDGAARLPLSSAP